MPSSQFSEAWSVVPPITYHGMWMSVVQGSHRDVVAVIMDVTGLDRPSLVFSVASSIQGLVMI
jgi:hypothetical protein